MKPEQSICKKALDTWGQVSQITIALEEMAELQKELCKHLRGENKRAEIAEEIADVEIMLEQMKILFDIKNLVKSEKERKLVRLEKRIKDYIG